VCVCVCVHACECVHVYMFCVVTTYLQKKKFVNTLFAKICLSPKKMSRKNVRIIVMMSECCAADIDRGKKKIAQYIFMKKQIVSIVIMTIARLLYAVNEILGLFCRI